MLEKAQEFVALRRTARLEARACPLRRIGKLAPQRMRIGELAPLVGEQQHRLREVERREGGIDGRGHDDVGNGNIGILKPRPLLAEQMPQREPSAPRVKISLAALSGAITGFAR